MDLSPIRKLSAEAREASKRLASFESALTYSRGSFIRALEIYRAIDNSFVDACDALCADLRGLLRLANLLDRLTDEGALERIKGAIRDADDSYGYQILLVRLVDGVSTYTLTFNGEEPSEHESHGDALDRVNALRDERRATAVLNALLAEDGQ